MKGRWPWLAVLAAVVLTGFFLPDLTLAAQDRRGEGQVETRAVDSPILVHAEDVGSWLDNIEVVRDSCMAAEATQGQVLSGGEVLEIAHRLMEGMALHGLISDRLNLEEMRMFPFPQVRCTEAGRGAVIWNVHPEDSVGAVWIVLDDQEGRLLSFQLMGDREDIFPLLSESDTAISPAEPDISGILDTMLAFCQESCAPLTCERADWQVVSMEDAEIDVRTAFFLSDGTDRSVEVGVVIEIIGDEWMACMFN